MSAAEDRPPSSSTPVSRDHPFAAPLLRRRCLNQPGSDKDTRHLELGIAGSGMDFAPGDSLGVLPQNDPDLVDTLVRELGATGREPVVDAAGVASDLRQALLRLEITRIGDPLLRILAERTGSPELAALIEPQHREHRERWAWGKDVLDVLHCYPELALTSQELVANLRPLRPRFYSIASSLREHPEEVHLCVGVVGFEAHGRRHQGVASTWLARHVTRGGVVPCFVHAAKRFRLPTDPVRDIIMIGPGTGIAPFRAFLQERRAAAAPGRNWLFFGDRHRATDFLYGDEFEAMQRDGHLTRLDVAFSRDQARKVYVQHRLWERADAIWAWLEGGAHCYVCGDALRMAKDVDHVLHRILCDRGGLSKEAAQQRLQSLKKAGRYQRDVYAI